MWVWLEPMDVLMFRDSRPFASGETHRARSLFPPSPLTFQGALRTALLSHKLARHNLALADFTPFLRAREKAHNPDLDQIVQALGDANQFGSFRMIGPFVAYKDPKDLAVKEVFFPIPYDVLGTKDGGVVSLSPLSESNNVYAQVIWDEGWNKGLEPLWWKGMEAKELPNFWLDFQGLRDYLEGNMGGIRAVAGGTIYAREQRVGIKLQPGIRTVETGMLYTAEFIRLQKGYGFVVRVDLEQEDKTDLEPLKNTDLIPLGGEARVCRYEQLSLDPLKELPGNTGKVGSEGTFKLYLATPAVFQHGWLPDFLEKNTLKGSIDGVELKLVATAVGKPWPVGGWDLAYNRPKELYYAVPPGSVYFFKLQQGDASKVEELFHGTTRLQQERGREKEGCPWLTELAKVGFGLTFVGRWNYCQLGG